VICALTVRQLKPGTFEDFRSAFMRFASPDSLPEGWVRFDMVRNTANPDEVVCFGFFDGTADDLRAAPGQDGYRRQQEEIAPYVESVGADGFFDVIEEHVAATH
jgi:heme-degrading monooxygenase HmoA